MRLALTLEDIHNLRLRLFTSVRETHRDMEFGKLSSPGLSTSASVLQR